MRNTLSRLASNDLFGIVCSINVARYAFRISSLPFDNRRWRRTPLASSNSRDDSDPLRQARTVNQLLRRRQYICLKYPSPSRRKPHRRQSSCMVCVRLLGARQERSKQSDEASAEILRPTRCPKRDMTTVGYLDRFAQRRSVRNR